MAEESLIKQNGEVVQSDEQKKLTIGKTDAASEKMPETEIKKRLSERAMEYLMFLDD